MANILNGWRFRVLMLITIVLPIAIRTMMHHPEYAPQAAAVIEGDETHTRTADLSLDLASVPGLSQTVLNSLSDTVVRAPVTQAVIYGWYDNEMGSYVNMLGDRVVSIAEQM